MSDHKSAPVSPSSNELTSILRKFFGGHGPSKAESNLQVELARLLLQARKSELEGLPWKRSDRYGINTPYVTKTWLVARKAALTKQMEE